MPSNLRVQPSCNIQRLRQDAQRRCRKMPSAEFLARKQSREIRYATRSNHKCVCRNPCYTANKMREFEIREIDVCCVSSHGLRLVTDNSSFFCVGVTGSCRLLQKTGVGRARNDSGNFSQQVILCLVALFCKCCCLSSCSCFLAVVFVICFGSWRFCVDELLILWNNNNNQRCFISDSCLRDASSSQSICPSPLFFALSAP